MDFQQYITQMQHTQATPSATPELSLFPHLQTLLENVTERSERTSVRFTQEPKRIDQIGRPDFIATDALLPIGYIEAEAYGRDLNALTGHAAQQNTRFIQNLDNFILTNFLDFQLYRDGRLRYAANIVDTPEQVEQLLHHFLTAEATAINSPEVLARYLARRTRELQTQIAETLKDENTETYQMFSAFKERLISTLTPADFADMYAQTLAYGLFAARCTLPNATNFSRQTASDALPRSNPFLVRLFQQVVFRDMETNVTYILDDIATLLRNVSPELLRTETFRTAEGSEDPVIHFYETFLAEYDPQRRVDRGVYYTPPQVIAYIVRSVDSLLKTTLHRRDGLADTSTLILDPATGTGGFLLQVLEHIRDSVMQKGSAMWPQYVNGGLVDRLFGFELLVAPYTIAHLKLGLFLQSQGWRSNERLGVYLTNTLDHPDEMQEPLPFAGFISEEANAALTVKRDAPILVILGNPPYQWNTTNPSRLNGKLTFIGELIEDYKQVDGEPLNEPNLKALQDDYVKFIRWAQWRIDKNGEGVVAYVVNNNFLNSVTTRGMRRSLMKSFSTIYCFNLHGSSRIEEATPEGETDENVFDIQQGNTILLCVKERGSSTPATVYSADLWGSRDEKYKTLSTTDVQTTDWRELQPALPYYLFVPQDTEQQAAYMEGWTLTDIFQVGSVGIATGRDKLTIHRTADAVQRTVVDFVSLPADAARETYNLPKDTRDWKVHLAQDDLRNYPDTEHHTQPINYRPFDAGWTYYTGKSKGFHSMPRRAIMSHLCQENLALCVCRIVTSPAWQHALITDKITEKGYVSNKTSEAARIFPLYLYPNPSELEISTERSLNFKPEFLKSLAAALDLPQTQPHHLPDSISPEQILGYIYAVLYSPTYRQRYYEFLKYDFPRIPIPKDSEQFHTLARLGETLIDAHLLKMRNENPTVHRFEGEGDAVVSKVRYADGHVWINRTQYFTDVPAAVWEYEIGAYRVCEKWLKDRRGEQLTYADSQQYCDILAALAQTLQRMSAIDKALWQNRSDQILPP